MDLKEYFNDKIDWKFLNFLCDKATKFEDELSITFDIEVFVYNRNSDSIYKYTSQKGGDWNTYQFYEPEYCIEKYEERKELVYVIITRKKNFDIYSYYKAVKLKADLINYEIGMSVINQFIALVPDKNVYR